MIPTLAIEASIICFALILLVAISRRHPRVRPRTAFVLTILTVSWVWLNLRTSGLQEAFNEEAPVGLDPVTKVMFWRGWPLAPVMLCLIHGNKFRPSALEGMALVFDGFSLFLILFLARLLSDRFKGPRSRGNVNGGHQNQTRREQ
jgi:hypothetical protein